MATSLLIIQTGFLGDAVLASGMLRTLHAHRPDIAVGMVVRSSVAPLFADHIALQRLYSLDKTNRKATPELVEELRQVGYGIAILPHRSFRTALIARRAGIPRRVGFKQGDARWLYTDKIHYRLSMHETERNASLLQAIGIEATSDIAPWLVPQPEARSRVEQRFHDGRPLMVLAPGSVWPTKRWTVEGYTRLVRALTKGGAHVVLVGSPDERPLCEQIGGEGGIGAHDVAAGELSLVDLLALISLAERVFTNDSAPLHLAESVGTPVTAIFGPTTPLFGFGPRAPRSTVVEHPNLDCKPCRIHGSQSCPIGTFECMTRISAEQVMAATAESEIRWLESAGLLKGDVGEQES